MKALHVALVLLMLAGIASADPVKGFFTEYAQAQAQAKKEDKPLYLHFTTTWCSWCRKIEADIYQNPEGEKILAPFVKASLDCTVPEGQQPSEAVAKNLELLQKYGGQGFPFLVITTPEGTVLSRFAGYLPLPEFQKQLEIALNVWNARKAMLACQAKGDTTSLEYHKSCLAYYTAAGEWVNAGQAADALLKLDPEGKQINLPEIRFAQFRAGLAAKLDAEKLAALRQAVADTDPKNEKGYLEKAYLSEVMALMMVGQDQDEQEQKETIEKMESLLRQTIQTIPTLSNPMQVYGLLFQIQAKLGKVDDAIATLEGLKSKAPEGVDLKQVDQALEHLRNTKQQMDADKGAASQPAGNGG